MKRLLVEATVLSIKESQVTKGCYYVTADAGDWGQVKYMTKKKRQKGDVVVLTDQKYRTASEMIRWNEKN